MKIYEMEQSDLLDYLEEIEGNEYSEERTIEESIEFWNSKKDFEKSEIIRQVLDRWNELEDRGDNIPNYYNVIGRERE